MTISVERQPRRFTVDEFLSAAQTGFPERLELVEGRIGPFGDPARLALLANWGVDAIIELTGPEIWRLALAARNPATQSI